MRYAVGQRVASHAESELGLGIVVAVDGRRVEVSFPAAGDSRVYAVDGAPLGRIEYQAGDVVSDMDDRALTITGLTQRDGLIVYDCVDAEGEKVSLHEVDLNCFVEFSTPRERLLAGHLDSLGHYRLRVATLHHTHRRQLSPLTGMLGTRTALIPHQIYIAAEVAGRYAPRVLLADEVGLGKTIEAGMILHQQLLTGRASRVLIVTPDNLLHQWLIEMLRRFNLRFALFDVERIDALTEAGEPNPFDTEQLVLISLKLLALEPKVLELAGDAGWDLLVVDEAHHLRWSADAAGPEYRCIETLAQRALGLIMLTGTPENLGAEGHFARLRLLDPERFHDLDAFRAEQAGYADVNRLIARLLDGPATVDPTDLQHLRARFGISGECAERDRIAAELLDVHGTGRVLFRNTRNAIRGFPERRVHAHPLDASGCYTPDQLSGEAGLCPEHQAENAGQAGSNNWPARDPRVSWLVRRLREPDGDKMLLICRYADTARQLNEHLLRLGIRSAAFHEGLTVVERDRRAAYFAQPEDGAQLLICSEIGSEGRNFQFAHHLTLFDLPLNPDLLQQRIGRLDRIGQTSAIDIHIPYLVDGTGAPTAQERLFRWYREGLNLFAASSDAAYQLYRVHRDELLAALGGGDEQNYDTFLRRARSQAEDIKKQLSAGRDRLLELNSCRPDVAAGLIRQIEQEQDPAALAQYLDALCDGFGIDCERHSDATWILTPGARMHSRHFPGLRPDGMTTTTNRELALAREDIEFLSWEHPLLAGGMETVLAGETGNTAAALLVSERLPTDGWLLEAWYGVSVVAPAELELRRYLPLSPTRLLLDGRDRDLARTMAVDKLEQLIRPAPEAAAQAALRDLRAPLARALDVTQRLADEALVDVRQQALRQMRDALPAELERLVALKQKNPNVREREIEFLRARIDASETRIAQASMQLQALRVILINPAS